MFDRISVSVSLSTILAVMARLVFLLKFKPGFFASNTFFPQDVTILIVAVFMIFFRGKMMHDDHQYFTDIERGRYSGTNKWVNKFGLFLGYVSWLLWAPAIYFLGNWSVFGIFMFFSLLVSLLWALLDYENIPAESPRHTDQKQHIWVLANLAYIAPMLVFWFSDDTQQMFRFLASIFLVLVLIIDWLISKPIATIIEAKH